MIFSLSLLDSTCRIWLGGLTQNPFLIQKNQSNLVYTKTSQAKTPFRDKVQSRGHSSRVFFRNRFAWTVSAHNAIPINKNRSLSSQSSQAKQNLFDCSNIQPHRTSPGPFLVRSSIWPILSKSFLRKNQSTTFFEKRNKTSVKLILRNRTPVGQ